MELIRACRRVNADALPEARAVLAALDRIPLTRDLVEEASRVGDISLRSVDAIHLASALSIREDLLAFFAYDHILAGTASAAGLESVRPGTDDFHWLRR